MIIVCYVLCECLLVEVAPLQHLEGVGRQERGGRVAVHHRLEDERVRLEDVPVEILVQEALGIFNLKSMICICFGI